MDAKERVWALYECYMESPTTICHRCNQKYVCGDDICNLCSDSTVLRTETEIFSKIYKDINWSINEQALTNLINSYKEQQKIKIRNKILRILVVISILIITPFILSWVGI